MDLSFFDWMVRFLIVPVGIALTGAFYAMIKRYRDSIAQAMKTHHDELDACLEKHKKQTDEAMTRIERHADLEFAKVWAEIRSVLSMQATQISEIAVLKVEQRNTWSRLEEIKDMVHETNSKLDKLLTGLVHRSS